MNVLLFLTDPVALDTTASRMINLDPLYVPTAGWWPNRCGNFNEEEIEIVGDALKDFICMDFNASPTISISLHESSPAPVTPTSMADWQ